jgi:hypothetical protein
MLFTMLSTMVILHLHCPAIEECYMAQLLTPYDFSLVQASALTYLTVTWFNQLVMNYKQIQNHEHKMNSSLLNSVFITSLIEVTTF